MDDPDDVRLHIRSCRTLHPDGRFTLARTVSCPRRSRSVALEACEECPRCTGIFPDDEDLFILCTARSAPDVVAGGHVSAVMAEAILCVREEVQVDVVRRLLTELEQQAVPVVDAIGRPTGILSRIDLLRLSPGDARPVRQVMTTFATTVTDSAPLEQAAALMALEGVHQLPVVSAGPDGKVIGMVSALDLARWVARNHGYLGEGSPL